MRYHKTLTLEKWKELSLMEQLANVGSEIVRALRWQRMGEKEYSIKAFHRALELLYLTKEDKKNLKRLKEITRSYEVLVDYFYGNNIYKTSAESLEKYFTQFAYISALKRGK